MSAFLHRFQATRAKGRIHGNRKGLGMPGAAYLIPGGPGACAVFGIGIFISVSVVITMISVMIFVVPQYATHSRPTTMGPMGPMAPPPSGSPRWGERPTCDTTWAAWE